MAQVMVHEGAGSAVLRILHMQHHLQLWVVSPTASGSQSQHCERPELVRKCTACAGPQAEAQDQFFVVRVACAASLSTVFAFELVDIQLGRVMLPGPYAA